MAWCLLKPQAKREIARIMLAGDSVMGRDENVKFAVPAPEKSIDKNYLEKVVRPKFAIAATWPDQIKGGESFLFEERIKADNAASPGIKPDEGGEDVRCKTWHYYDVPIFDSNPPHPPRESNAIYALDKVTSEFEKQQAQSTPDSRVQVVDLYWIEHIVGDIHQPLHCVSSYAFNAKHGDAGGNGFKLDRGNLHSYWDAGIDRAIRADKAFAEKSDAASVSAAWLKDKSLRPRYGDEPWKEVVEDNAGFAQSSVYAGLVQGQAPSAGYASIQAAECKRLAVFAAVRLANYLNRVLAAKR